MSARSEQVAEALATRERQVTDERAIEELLEDQPTHHGYGLNVKQRTGPWCECWDDDEVPYGACWCGLEDARERFWRDADELAREHGFKGVHSAGRMGGWLVIDPQPRTDDMWPDDVEEWERETFGPFALAIRGLYEHACERWSEHGPDQ